MSLRERPLEPARVPSAGRRAHSRTSWSRRRAVALFCVPAVGLLVVFLAVPFVLAVHLSFTSQRLTSPLPRHWVGWGNYRALWHDESFRKALLNTFVFALVVVPVQTVLALALAVLVNQKTRGIRIFRAIFFGPVVMGIAVASSVWFLLLDRSNGLVNGALRTLTLGHVHPDWLQSTHTALLAIIIVSIWSSVGFQMVIILAGLQDVPTDVLEAAEVDGANAWQRFVHVTLPAIRNTLVFVTTMTTIFAFRLFDQVYIMTQGGPLGSTDTVLLELVKVGYERQQVARACAIAVVFFCIVVTVTIVQRLFVRERR